MRLRAALCLLSCAIPALATQRTLAQTEPLAAVEVTNASSAFYNFDNRDTRRGQVASVANDHFGLLYNRLNLSATRGALTLALRADSAWFFAAPSPDGIARSLSSREHFQSPSEANDFYRGKLDEAGIELSNRFINWSYPAKYSISWGTPDFELSVGDSYAQLGRGLVLSLRKLDELASDTTLRGVRLGARTRVSDARLKLSLLFGSANPLRIDEASGRYLGSDTSVNGGFLRLTEAGMPHAIATDFAPLTGDCTRSATCSYAPDRLAGGQLEVALARAVFSTQASFLARGPALAPDSVRSADRITSVSQALEIPLWLGHGSTYVEAALQHLGHSEPSAQNLDTGYALYGTTSWVERRFSLVAEGKHYRRFFPLSANVSSARAREFSLLGYSAPPTTEEIWNDTQFGNFNTCVSGGRLKAEAHATRAHSVFAWVGRYSSYAESVSNDRCDTSAAHENRVWDVALGLDEQRRERRARWLFTLGARFDDASRELDGPSGPTHVFYREVYLRYAVSEPLRGPFTLELQGFHRRRRETIGGPDDRWFEGQHSTGIEWGEKLAAALGLEYDSRPDTPLAYVNAMLSYRPSPALSLALFAGQRRGALRCVGGVCRVYPAFEGVRLDATLRY